MTIDCILRHMNLSRVSIEFAFKRSRMVLVRNTHGSQIPWVHTSLIGKFCLNPDTIYDGVVYTDDVYADSRFLFKRGSEIVEIVEKLKSYDRHRKNLTVRKFQVLDYKPVSAKELFVLGRNIYQASVGKSQCVYLIYRIFPVFCLYS